MAADGRMTAWEDGPETPSGKKAKDENFPVASILLPGRLRHHVRLFYDFAREADDIADNPDLDPDDKIARLDRFADAIITPNGPEGVPVTGRRLRRSLEETGVSSRHCLDLIEAFRQDARRSRRNTWDDLVDYCNLSAAPVGRYLIDLHGEPDSAYSASDALCNALQVLNHLQDCRQDYRNLKRVYLPLEWFSQAGIGVEALDGNRSEPAVREVLDHCLDATGNLLVLAAPLPDRLHGVRFAAEAAAILAIANKLGSDLATRDPLAERVVLTRMQYAACCMRGPLDVLSRRLGLRRRR